MERMLVKEIMNTRLVKIKPSQTVYDAAFLLRENKVGSIIVEENDTVLGFITKRDIIGGTTLEHKNPDTTPLSEIMVKDIITINPLENITKALELMEKHKIKKLLVEKNSEIIGIITLTDISKNTREVTRRVIDTCFIEQTH